MMQVFSYFIKFVLIKWKDYALPFVLLYFSKKCLNPFLSNIRSEIMSDAFFIFEDYVRLLDKVSKADE